jgi:DNA-binding MarR family transcriptional regulator
MSRPRRDTANEEIADAARSGHDVDAAISLERFTPALITWAAHKLAANNSAVYRKLFNVTLMEWRIMLHLCAEPNANAAKLASVIGFDKATISRTVDNLHRRALVDERHDPLDGRSSQLYLTEQGLDLYRRILPVALAQERELLGDLSREEADTFVSLLGRVVGALRSHSHRAAGAHSPTAGTMRRLQRRKQATDREDAVN